MQDTPIKRHCMYAHQVDTISFHDNWLNLTKSKWGFLYGRLNGHYLCRTDWMCAVNSLNLFFRGRRQGRQPLDMIYYDIHWYTAMTYFVQELQPASPSACVWASWHAYGIQSQAQEPQQIITNPANVAWILNAFSFVLTTIVRDSSSTETHLHFFAFTCCSNLVTRVSSLKASDVWLLATYHAVLFLSAPSASSRSASGELWNVTHVEAKLSQ